MAGGKGKEKLLKRTKMKISNFEQKYNMSALSKNIVIYHCGERRVRRVLRLFNHCLFFLMPLRSPCALR